MANLEGENIRRQYLSKILPPKLVPLTKDVPTPGFLLVNNLNDRIGTTETSQKCYGPIPILLTIKIQKTCKDSQKILETKTTGTTAAAKPKVTATTKTMTGVSIIAIPQEKLSCNEVGSTTILKFQQDYSNSEERERFRTLEHETSKTI